MSRVAVIGAGYVGLTTAACLADLGNEVTVVDIDQAKIAQLKRHQVPIYEPGLGELVERNTRAGRLSFTTSYVDAVPGAEFAIIAVSTPEGEGGEADLSHVEAAASSIADAMDGPLIVVNKSTVPPLTGDMVSRVLKKGNNTYDAAVVSNPEFLREGSAIQDFMHPDRVVIGSNDREAADKVAKLYEPLNAHVLVMPNIYTAEMVKYASNAFLATRISFINEIAWISERVGADAKLVAEGMGMDKRIGPHYLDAGIGYGGSCLAGDETVLVKLDGRTRLLTLMHLVHEYRVGQSLEVLSWHADGSGAEFLPVKAVTLRPFEGDAIEVRTKMGRRVVCTPDHPFVTRGGTKLARDLTTADWLPLALHATHDEHPMVELDLLKGLEMARIARAEVIVRPAAAVLAGVSARDAQLSSEGATVKTARNGTDVPMRLAADAEFWRIIGLYLAEGHISRDGRRERISWSFNHTGEEDLVEEVRGFWARHGVKADVRHAQTSTSIVVSSRILAGFLEGVLKAGRNCYEMRLPDQVWSQPREHKLALLGGYWHGDGSWSFVNGGPSVVLECGTVSRALADGLLRLLADLGVVASVRVGRVKKSTRDTYWIRCAGADQVTKLIDLVPAQHRPAVLASLGRQAKRIAATGYRRQEHGTAWVRVVETRRRPYAGPVYSLEVP